MYRSQGARPSPQKKKCKKAKWLSEEALQIAMKKSEMQRKKGKIYPSECRVARRDKKVFLSEQCKEIEESNRMGQTRDLFKKTKDNKGSFNAKMATIKDRNGTDLQKQKILRRGSKNTQNNYTKKIFMTQIIMMV